MLKLYEKIKKPAKIMFCWTISGALFYAARDLEHDTLKLVELFVLFLIITSCGEVAFKNMEMIANENNEALGYDKEHD